MWLLVVTISAIIVTLIWYFQGSEHRESTKLLSLLLWGGTIMVFVDRLMNYMLYDEEFIDFSTNAIILSFIIIVTVLALWKFIMFFGKSKPLEKI